METVRRYSATSCQQHLMTDSSPEESDRITVTLEVWKCHGKKKPINLVAESNFACQDMESFFLPWNVILRTKNDSMAVLGHLICFYSSSSKLHGYPQISIGCHMLLSMVIFFFYWYEISTWHLDHMLLNITWIPRYIRVGMRVVFPVQCDCGWQELV